MNLSAKLATMFLIVVALGTIGTTATAFAQSEEETLEQRESNTDVVVQSTQEEGVEEEDGENNVEEEANVEEDGKEEEGEEEPEIDEEQQAAIEIADQAVHEAFPPEEGEEVSEEDVLFHQGLCAVGITTEALEGLGGCEVLPPFGED
jgi:homoserine dehydrogenase